MNENTRSRRYPVTFRLTKNDPYTTEELATNFFIAHTRAQHGQTHMKGTPPFRGCTFRIGGQFQRYTPETGVYLSNCAGVSKVHPRNGGVPSKRGPFQKFTVGSCQPLARFFSGVRRLFKFSDPLTHVPRLHHAPSPHPPPRYHAHAPSRARSTRRGQTARQTMHACSVFPILPSDRALPTRSSASMFCPA